MRIWMITASLGIALVAWLPSLPNRWLLYAVLVGLVFVTMLMTNHWRRYATLLLITWLGVIWGVEYGYRLLENQLPVDLEGRELWIEGEVVGIPLVRDRYQQFDINVASAACADLPACAPSLKRVRLKWYNDRDNPLATSEQLIPGAKWRLLVKAKKPHGNANPGGFDYQSWLIQHNISAVGYVRRSDENQQIGTATLSIDHWRWRWAQHVDRLLVNLPQRGILLALLIGDKQGISPAERQLFAQTGTSHLMVISGLHIGLIAAVGYWLGRGLALLLIGWRIAPEILAVVCATTMALVYSAAAGFSLPTQRALVMLAVVMWAIVRRRQLLPAQTLLTALLLCLIIDPLAPASLSFWLSFGAVAVILYGLCGRIGIATWRQGLHIQWLVFIGLIPVTAAALGTISYISPLANTIAVPLFSFFIVPVNFLAALLSLVAEHWATVIWQALNAALVWLVDFLQWLNSSVTSGPIGLPVLSAIQISLAVVAVVLLLLPRAIPMRYSGLVLLLPLLLAKSEPIPHAAADITVLDVGQGLAVVVQTAQHTLVYDLGPLYGEDHGEQRGAANTVVLPYLQYRGVSALDMLVLSHNDSDHAGAWRSLLTAIDTRNVRTGQTLPGLVFNAQQRLCREPEQWQWDGVEFTFLYPWQSGTVAKKNNDHSCVLKIAIGDTSLLLTGDIERTVELLLVQHYRDMLSADIVLAPHHGSGSSSSWPFVRFVNPQHVVFSAGYRNPFNHPKANVVARYQQIGSELYNTAADGAITFRIRDGRIAMVEKQRTKQRRYWLF